MKANSRLKSPGFGPKKDFQLSAIWDQVASKPLKLDPVQVEALGVPLSGTLPVNPFNWDPGIRAFCWSSTRNFVLKIKIIYFILSCHSTAASKRIESMCDIYLYSKRTSSSLSRVPFQRSGAACAGDAGSHERNLLHPPPLQIPESHLSCRAKRLSRGGLLKELNTPRPGNNGILFRKEE